MLLGLLCSPVLVAGEKDEDGTQSSKAMALPETHRLTLTLIEGGETYAFSGNRRAPPRQHLERQYSFAER
jgi:hypothetical protein